ncbi:MAG: ubiquinone/menaquinone biosynthesis methyltransferase [Kiritimatiellae bacterium]|nr:ubiquinone/menaquinone biosynthesis methyltransferase [Kiritimatiellia bacterium]
MTRRLFTDIAAIYDRMNHLLSLGLDLRWRRLAVEGIGGGPLRVLDLACGTGDSTLALARRFPSAEIVGVDITPAMLDMARRKCAAPNMRFMEGDAQGLPAAAAGPFDACMCAFGFRNFPDRRKALREVGRVLAPGGELVVLEFFRPANAALGWFTAWWLRLVAGLLVRRQSAAYRYLRESMANMLTEDAFIALAAEECFHLETRRFFAPCCTCLRFRVFRG